MTDRTIAALFVEENGCYYGLDGVEPWGVSRDARKYDGPFPVVAHPPCALAVVGDVEGRVYCNLEEGGKHSVMTTGALRMHWKRCASMEGVIESSCYVKSIHALWSCQTQPQRWMVIGRFVWRVHLHCVISATMDTWPAR